MNLPRRAVGLAAAAIIGIGGVGTLSACSSGSATTTSSATSTASTTSAANAAGAAQGQPPGGGGAGGGSATVTALGTWTVDSGTQTSSGKSYAASAANTSGVLATGGTLTLTDASVSTTGSSTSSDESSFYGLDAGVLAKNATVSMTGGTVTTTGDGANGVFAYGTATVTLTNVTVKASGRYAHGIMASGGGTITATNVSANTTKSNGAVIATDRGGGTISVKGGTYSTSGTDSPGIYSTGTITVTGATVTATGAEAAVIEGSNTITLTDTTISGAKKSGVMLYQSMSGDASGTQSAYTQTGGSLSAAEGPLFYVTNTTGTITVSGVTLTPTSGVLLKAAADTWGTSGSNGGNATFGATSETLTGDVVADNVSTVALTLDNSTWSGALDSANTAKSAALTLTGSSTWSVTADSSVDALTGAVISGDTVTNITGNGHTVYYSTASSPQLGGKTYTLAGGGTLKPVS